MASASLVVKVSANTTGFEKGIANVTTATKKSADTIGEMGEAATRLAGALGIAFTVDRVAAFGGAAITAAARFESLGVAINKMGQNAGLSAQATQGAERVLHGLGFSLQEARDGVFSMAKAHIDLAKAQELGKRALDLSIPAQMSEAEVLDDISRALATGQSRTLTQVGVFADFTGALKTAADAQHVHVDQLTEAQIEQARLDEIMRKSAIYDGTYDQAAGGTTRAIKDLGDAWDDLKVKIGKALGPITPLVEGLTMIAEAIGTLSDAISAHYKDSQDYLDHLPGGKKYITAGMGNVHQIEDTVFGRAKQPDIVVHQDAAGAAAEQAASQAKLFAWLVSGETGFEAPPGGVFGRPKALFTPPRRQSLGLDTFSPTVPMGPEASHIIAVDQQFKDLKTHLELFGLAAGNVSTVLKSAAIDIASAAANLLATGGGRTGMGAQVVGGIGAAAGSGLASDLFKGAGAVMGSVVPVVGSAIGALVGGVIGSGFDKLFHSADKAADAFDRITSSLLNIPTGFSIAGHEFAAASVGPRLTPDAGNSGRGYGEGGDTGYGGSGSAPPRGAALTVNVMVDGQQLGRAVVTNLQRTAQSQLGSSAKWAQVSF